MTYHTNAVSIGDVKNAALYFDHLVPVLIATEYFREQDRTFLLESQIIRSMLPPQFLHNPQFDEAFAEVNIRCMYVLLKHLKRLSANNPRIKIANDPHFETASENADKTYSSFIQEFDLTNWPLVTHGGPATAAMQPDASEDALPLLTVSRLKVVDGSRLSWEEIREIRVDPAARDKLRRLRLFAYENYYGKSREFVEDDLLSRIYDYDASAKALGLETVQGALSFMVNSKLAAGVLASSFVSALFGQPMAALVAGAAGAVLEISGFAVELIRRRQAMESLGRESPVSYISYLRKQAQRSGELQPL